MGVYKKGSTMFEILTLILFGWLVWKAFGLFFKITWGLAKIIAALLLIFAFPLLFVCIAFIGGIAAPHHFDRCGCWHPEGLCLI